MRAVKKYYHCAIPAGRRRLKWVWITPVTSRPMVAAPVARKGVITTACLNSGSVTGSTASVFTHNVARNWLNNPAGLPQKTRTMGEEEGRTFGRPITEAEAMAVSLEEVIGELERFLGEKM